MRAAAVRVLVARMLDDLPGRAGDKPLEDPRQDAAARAAFALIMTKLLEEADAVIKQERALRLQAAAAKFLAKTPEAREEVKRLVERANKLRVPDTMIITGPRLAVELGWSLPTAQKQLTYLCEIGYLQRTNERGNGRYRIVSLDPPKPVAAHPELTIPNSEALIARVPHARREVDRIIAGHPSALLSVIRAAAHPAFTHHPKFSHRHWLYLLMRAGNVNVSRVGFTEAGGTRTRRQLRAGRIAHEVVGFPIFCTQLDALADTQTEGVSARERRAAALATYEGSAASKSAKIKRDAELKKRTYAAIERILTKYPVPAQPQQGRKLHELEKREELATWKTKLHALFSKDAFSDEYRSFAARSLEGRLLNEGYGPEYAHSTARWVVYDEAPPRAERRSPAEQSEPEQPEAFAQVQWKGAGRPASARRPA